MMDKNERIAKRKTLSKRAQKLYLRIQTGDYYYPAYSERTPKAMQELVDCELVGTAGRYPIIALYFVPKGFKLTHEESFPVQILANEL